MGMTVAVALGCPHPRSVERVVSAWCFCGVFPEFVSPLGHFAQDVFRVKRLRAESLCAVSWENAHMAMGFRKQIHLTDICTMFL